MRLLTLVWGLLIPLHALALDTNNINDYGLQTGVISGQIIEADTQLPLPGAHVIVTGSTAGTVSDLQGRFQIKALETGVYELTVSYLGYKTEKIDVDVFAGETSEIQVDLEAVYIESDGIVVEGTRQGQARALNQQKAAAGIKNVVAADLIGRFPDPNSAEALQRMPGVSVQRDHGEARYVLIRGTEPRLTSVMINGEQIPAPEGAVRYAALDVIPADQLAFIEVNKAITPDMDADGIGGSVNLITRSAVSSRPVAQATLASGYTNLIGGMNLQGAASFGRRFGKQNQWGFLTGGSHYTIDRGTDKIETEWDDVEFNGADQSVIDDVQLRDYVITRTRSAVNSTLEYRPSARASFYFRSLYNRFADQEYRRRLRYRFGKGDYVTPNSVDDATIERETKDRFEVQQVLSLTTGGSVGLQQDWQLNYSFSYSFANEVEPDRRDFTTRRKDVDLSYGVDEESLPDISVTDGTDLNDASLFEFKGLETQSNRTTDQDLTARFDMQRSFRSSFGEGKIQWGAKLRNKDKTRRQEIREFEHDELMLSDVVGSYENDDYFEGRYNLGYSADPDAVEQFFLDNQADFEEDLDVYHRESDPATYEATERVWAGYAMTDVQKNDWKVLAGLRYEYNEIAYTGREVSFNEDGDYVGTDLLEGNNEFGRFFPMLHVRYQPSDHTIYRFAATSSLARPNYHDLVPFRLIDLEDEEAVIGNPLLRPTTSTNIDLNAERYLSSLGLISVGVFAKRLDAFIFPSISEPTEGIFAGLEVEQSQNGGSATLAGAEISWQQQLTFLPGALNGLGIHANYTYTWSEANFLTRETLRLPGQSSHMGNVSVSYERNGFTGRVSANLHGAYLDQVGKDAPSDVYYDKHVQVDVSASKHLGRGIRVFGEILNITNAPLRYYQGTRLRPIQQDFYSWWSHFGLKVDF